MTVGTVKRSKAAGLLALLALTGTGCSTVGPQAMLKQGPPTGTPCFAITVWSKQVYLNPDPYHGGFQAPTLAGNMYLLGEGKDFITARGNVIVDLFDVTYKDRDPQMLERYIFDPDTLKKLLVKDNMGWSWKLILPWGSYRPDITKVELKTQFVREGSTTGLFADPAELALATPDHPQELPGARAQEMAQGPPPMNPPSAGVQQTSHLIAPSQSPGFNPGMQQGLLPMAPSPNPVPPPGVQPSMPVTMTTLSGPGMQQPQMMMPGTPNVGMQQPLGSPLR
jgi:hypothetical protein